MAKIIITGNKGFIGSRLQHELEKSHDVTGFDRENDIREELDFTDADLVIHCAAEISRLYGEEKPRLMLDTNLLGTLNVIKACLRSGSKLLNFSTSEVYGLALLEGEDYVEEDMEKISPFKMTNIYGASKLFAETIIRHFVNNYGLKAISVRPFMVYGAGQMPSKYRAAIDQFVVAALRNRELNVHKDSMRAWCHITDFIRAIELIIAREKWEKYEAYNIGVNEYYTMEEVAKKIIEKVGMGSINMVEPPKILVVKKKVSFDKIEKLGFKQSIYLDKGIDELIEWHKKY